MPLSPQHLNFGNLPFEFSNVETAKAIVIPFPYESTTSYRGGTIPTSIVDAMAKNETLQIVDRTSPYALTGAVFARERTALREATLALRQSAGNFYLNDKPTGAVVGQQPFGGARASGTNDKAGSKLNLLRWASVRTIKETFVPPTDHRYPFMAEE